MECASWLGPAFVLVYWMDCDCGGAKKAGAAGYTLLVTVTGVQRGVNGPS